MEVQLKRVLIPVTPAKCPITH